MRVLLFFDQTQAGAGGKERPDVELAVEKGGIGSYTMFKPYLDEVGGQVLATMYCGDGYFFKNEEEVKRKVTGLVDKLQADIVLCGPCFNYNNYARMSAILADEIENQTDAKAVAMCSKENEDVIEEYKEQVKIIKMPKKGGTGLTQSLQNMSKVLKAVVEEDDPVNYEEYLY